MAVDPLASELKSLNDRVYALERRGMYPPAVVDSAWNVIGASGQPAFQNSWANFPTGGWPSMAFFRDSEGWVHLRGLVTGGVNGTTICTLPVGYRPAFPYNFNIVGSDTFAFGEVRPDGTVLVSGPLAASAGTWYALANICFPVWGLDNLVTVRPNIFSFINDGFVRIPHIYVRRSGVYELMGLSGALANGYTTSLVGFSSLSTDIFPVITGNLGTGVYSAARIDQEPGSLAVRVGSATSYAVLGGIRWPSTSLDPLFIAPTLQNGWVNYPANTGTNFSPAGYFKDSNGIVHLRGLVRFGTAGAAIFTLPAGYRPGGRSMFPCDSAAPANYGGIEVSTAGVVTNRSGLNAYVSLAGIQFLAEN